MSKSKKDTNQDNAELQNSPKQTGRRQFLRKAGVAGVAAVAAAGLTTLAKAQDSDKVSVNVKLDAEKVQAIQKCLAKGTLRISMSKAEASSGDKTKTDPWLYD